MAKIDFSGTWESRQPPSGRLGGPMVPNLNAAADPPLANFANIGQNFKEGLPFTPWAAELRKQRMATNSKENPDANCLPLGFMQLHTHSQPRKVVQNVNDLVIMYEANSGLRNIFTDGRSLPVERSAAVVVRLLSGQVRRRHPCRRHDRAARRRVARRPGRAVHQAARRSPRDSAGRDSAEWKSTSRSTTRRLTRSPGRCA